MSLPTVAIVLSGNALNLHVPSGTTVKCPLLVDGHLPSLTMTTRDPTLAGTAVGGQQPTLTANALARERIGTHAKRLGVGRRTFLETLCAAATTLGTLNEAFAAQGNTGGSFRLPKEATYESAAARSALAGDEFIFDVQTHMVDPAGKWRTNAGKYWEQILAYFPQGACGDRDPIDCFSAEKFIKHVFMDSDTDLA